MTGVQTCALPISATTEIYTMVDTLSLHDALPISGSLGTCGPFADLLWPPCGDRDYVLARTDADPAFTLTGYSRWVALGRILDEIRFYAGPIPEGAPRWWWSGEDPSRVAAVEAEENGCELAIFESVADAVTFTVSYLGGVGFCDIAVVRITPTHAAGAP